MNHARKVLLTAARAAVALLISAWVLAPSPTWAGMPVIDAANLRQNLMTAFQSVEQTLKQIQQYQTQLEQYENMLRNTVAPAAYVWDKANSIVTRVTEVNDTLNYYKRRAGSIDAYLSKFQNVNYYRASPCFKRDGCTAADERTMKEAQTLGSEAIKRSNDAVFRGLDQQQRQLQTDADQLVLLQSRAQGAEGQMAAIQYGNQLASNQANQLLQIRAMLIAQQQAAHEASVEPRGAGMPTNAKRW